MAIPRNLANLANQLNTDGEVPKIEVGDSKVEVTDTGSNGTIVFNTDNAERMRVTNAGNVGIGTNSPNAAGFASDSKVLSVRGTSADNFGVLELAAPSVTGSNRFGEIRFQNIAASGAFGFSGIRVTRAGADDSSDMGFWTASANSAAERMSISNNGDLILAGSTAQKASGTTWSNPSDQRLKNNIRDYKNGLAELVQVRVREWEYNGKGGTTEGSKGIGVVADEIMSVLPNTVNTYKATLNEDDQETTDIKRFDATEITWLLVKAVQELSAKNDALEARIAALEAQ